MPATRPLSPGFGAEALGVDVSAPLSDAAFADDLRRLLRRPGAAAARPAPDARAVPRLRAPLRSARAARDRPVPPSGGGGHPDPVQRRAGRPAAGPGRRGHVLPHRLLVPRRAGARDDAVLDRVAAGRRQHGLREPVRRVRRPARRDEAPHRRSRRRPPLRQSQRRERGEPHGRLAPHRRAEGAHAADHASDRAHASGHRPQGALLGVGQLVRHRRHARRRGARAARRARRARDARASTCSASTTSRAIS